VRLLTITEVAEALRCSETSARRLMRSGALPAAKIAGAWKVSDAAVEAYYAEALTEQAMPLRRRRRRAS